MGHGSNKAMGKSSIFSGSGSKKGLSKKLGVTFYGEKDMSYPGGVPGPGKVTDSAEKQNAGFNFSPPSNPRSKSELQAGKGKQKHSYKKDYASYAYDSDQDGDSITNDYNQDGTMLGRGIKAAKKFFGGGPGKVTDPKDGVVVSGDKDKVNNTVTKTNTKDQKIALLKEKRAIARAKALEKQKEKRELLKVKRDLEINKRNQLIRKSQGKDYQVGTGTADQKTVRRS